VRRAVIVNAIALGLAACSAPVPTLDSGTPDAGDAGCAAYQRPDGGDLPPAVWAVMHGKCQTCHTQPLLNNAKKTLLTYEDTQSRYGITDQQYWQRMDEVIQADGVPHMPYMDAPQLTPGEFSTLDGWLKACAPPVPEGTGCDSLPDGGVLPTTAACDAGNPDGGP
jgi:hypothetical protein